MFKSMIFKTKIDLAMVAHTCNASAWKPEAGALTKLDPKQVPVHCFLKKKKYTKPCQTKPKV